MQTQVVRVVVGAAAGALAFLLLAQVFLLVDGATGRTVNLVLAGLVLTGAFVVGLHLRTIAYAGATTVLVLTVLSLLTAEHSAPSGMLIDPVDLVRYGAANPAVITPAVGALLGALGPRLASRRRRNHRPATHT